MKRGISEQEMAQQLRLGLLKAYGLEEGLRTAEAVVPGILRDFRNMLLAGDAGAEVTETYRTEDLRSEIVLKGHRESTGKLWFDEGTVRRL